MGTDVIADLYINNYKKKSSVMERGEKIAGMINGYMNSQNDIKRNKVWS